VKEPLGARSEKTLKKVRGYRKESYHQNLGGPIFKIVQRGHEQPKVVLDKHRVATKHKMQDNSPVWLLGDISISDSGVDRYRFTRMEGCVTRDDVVNFDYDAHLRDHAGEPFYGNCNKALAPQLPTHKKPNGVLSMGFKIQGVQKTILKAYPEMKDEVTQYETSSKKRVRSARKTACKSKGSLQKRDDDSESQASKTNSVSSKRSRSLDDETPPTSDQFLTIDPLKEMALQIRSLNTFENKNVEMWILSQWHQEQGIDYHLNDSSVDYQLHVAEAAHAMEGLGLGFNENYII